jgi:Fic family protein
MTENISDEEWDEIESRVLRNIPIGSVKTEREFHDVLLSNFFQGRSEDELSKKQVKLGEIIWNDLADGYEKEFDKGKKEYVEINIKEYPTEARRFTRAIKFYKNILNLFNKGYNRRDVSKYYSHKTKRKQSTINRDISAFVKLGVIQRHGKRGYYRSKKNVYV